VERVVTTGVVGADFLDFAGADFPDFAGAGFLTGAALPSRPLPIAEFNKSSSKNASRSQRRGRK
jgi:hypothetical protein